MSNAVVVIPSEQEMKERARLNARETLSRSSVFQSLPLVEQKSLYLSLVQECLDKEKEKHGFSKPMAASGEDMGFKGYDPGFSGDTKAFTELVESVDFPKFVADLLKAVFNANLKVMKEQTDSYIKLMKEATKSTADFIKKIKDDESFLKLAETRGGQYNVTTEKQADGSSKFALTNPAGEKVDTDDAQVKAHIMDAKIRMAQEHRAALREVLLMGVTRLVVEKGEIEAGVSFSVKATRASDVRHDDQNVSVVGHDSSGSGEFLGVGASFSTSVSNTNIQVNTSGKKATDDLSAELKGKVKIIFKTDYFKLDNFANMYADGGTAALKPPTQGAPAGK